jgi:hypothetical protein
VTAFRDYLACPYRFYLTYIRRLGPLDDRAVEMDASRFGLMAHHVLSTFALSDLAGSADAEAIAAFLGDGLEALVRSRYGNEPATAVMIQSEHLRQRLAAFAQWQAQQVQSGWRILPQWIEADLEAQLDADAGPKTVTGRIDRIDEHAQLGYRVIDYKTADTARTPEKTHRRSIEGEKQWIDLQLPLYRALAEAAGINGPIELGYLLMPKVQEKVGYFPASWTDGELKSAVAEAGRIINAIDNGIFWPPSDPPDYEDGLGPICMDPCLERADAVVETGRHLARVGPSAIFPEPDA